MWGGRGRQRGKGEEIRDKRRTEGKKEKLVGKQRGKRDERVRRGREEEKSATF